MRTSIGKIVVVVLTVMILFLNELPNDEVPLNGKVSGVVIDAEDTFPVSGAEVVLEPGGNIYHTDSVGKYEFGYMKPGYYKIHVSKRGYKTRTKRVKIVRGETKIKELSLNRSSS